MDRETSGTQHRTDAGEHVLVMMRPGRDRELLVEWLRTIPAYTVTVMSDSDGVPEQYDLGVLDVASLETHKSTIDQHRADASPAYLPHVLLLAGGKTLDEIRTDEHGQPPTQPSVVDDVLTLPLSKDLLHRRLENLLKIRRAGSRISTQQAQYRHLLQIIPEAVLLIEDGSVVYANETAATVFEGRTASEVVGQPVESLVAPADQDTLQSLLADIRDGTIEHDDRFVEITVQSLQGRDHPAMVTGVTATFEGRPVTQLLLRDLTEQQKQEAQLALLGRAIDAATQGITIADATADDNPLIYANQGFESITGYSIEEVLGRNCRFLQGPDTDEETVETMRRAIDDTEPVTVEILNYRKDGTSFWNRVDIVPIFDERGEPTHFLGFQRDVTERKEREQRLSVVNQILRHNLGNKMTVIQGLAEQLESAEEPPEGAARTIRTAAEELVAISDRLREVNTIGTGIRHEAERIDLVAVIESELATLHQHHPEIETTLSAPSSATIAAHPTLERLLTAFVARIGEGEGAHCGIEIAQTDETVTVDCALRGDELSQSELDVLNPDVEAPYSSVEGIELWLLKWAVDWSQGTVTVERTDSETRVSFEFDAVGEN